MMFKKIILAAAMLTAITTVHAAATAPFGVSGSITPTACAVTLTGGVASLGTLSFATVKSYGQNATGYNMTPVVVPVGITCPSAMKVALSFTDNLAGKIVAMDSNDAMRFGLVNGTSGTTAIGSYQLSLTSVTLDSNAVGSLMVAPGVATPTAWSSTGAAGLNSSFPLPGYSTTFSKSTSSTTPDSFTTMAGSLTISATIGTAYLGAATATITPNGSGTLALIYL